MVVVVVVVVVVVDEVVDVVVLVGTEVVVVVGAAVVDSPDDALFTSVGPLIAAATTTIAMKNANRLAAPMATGGTHDRELATGTTAPRGISRGIRNTICNRPFLPRSINAADPTQPPRTGACTEQELVLGLCKR